MDLTVAQVEFKVNNVRTDYAMKLGEGGEAFFVFETADSIPEALQTSPLVSPEVSPAQKPAEYIPSIGLAEPEPLDLATDTQTGDTKQTHPPDRPGLPALERKSRSEIGTEIGRSMHRRIS